MILQPIDVFVWAWLILCVLSAAYVAWDQFRGNPEPAVMKWGFVLVTLYMGPVGLLLYVLADKEPRAGTHEAFTAPLWKQGVGSTVHCVAGDATGIITAAVIVAMLGLPMWADLLVEYAAGFTFGLLIFQALFMRGVMGGSYVQNVRRSFVPEFISMNAMMAGMAPVMALLMMGRDMRAMSPSEPLFWAVMSLGVTVGFAVAYPVNVWLVSRGLKHGLMTVRPEKRAAGHGGHAVAHGAHAEHQTQGDTAHSDAHDMHGMGGSDPVFRVTQPQLVAVGGLTTLMLLFGLTLPWAFVNMRLSAHDVGGIIMPPGMIMTPETPAAAMRDMAAADPRLVRASAPLTARGDQVLAPHLVGGVKRYRLSVGVSGWTILPGRTVTAYAINGTVPGPRLELEQGDRVRIEVTNALPESTTLHWHGLILDNAMDGPAEITQRPIEPGGSYTYTFTALQVGTYFYHSHDHVDRQQALGLYGALLIRPTADPTKLARVRALTRPGDPATAPEPVGQDRADHEYTVQLQEWLLRDGLTYPAMPMEGGLPNYFTINGKAYPATDTVRMRVGETLKLRFIGSNNISIHPMHVHGGPFTVVARDGETLPAGARFLADTVNVGPGQRYDVVWAARRPGRWLLHCHIPHHTTNNNVEEQGAGGLTMVIDVQE
ncbi:DUF4396 domain-containing protein [Deinococcus koreensis]|uniref:Copper oxidase n=1 Tax=Deinococcus koreensis TaxID=2054903 RepID=A0A2K3UYT1_9DEIO|nr:DUF4396 domain-containing protein [Deinococcus koreensis]PNY81682.1 copper oxidase [Deinococcus koreensis]